MRWDLNYSRNQGKFYRILAIKFPEKYPIWNTTTLGQPVDKGSITNLKSLYRAKLVNHIVDTTPKCTDIKS
jgi:hypothetical protein